MRPKLRLDATAGWFCAGEGAQGRVSAGPEAQRPERAVLSGRYDEPERRRLTTGLVEPLLDGLQPRLELGVLLVDLLVGVLQECLEVLDALVACDELALGECDVPLERRVLVDELLGEDMVSRGMRELERAERWTDLLLHERELVEVAREEVHLALLGLAVRVLGKVAVILARLVKRDFELDDLASGKTASACCSTKRGRKREERTFSQRSCRSRMRLFFMASKSASCCATALCWRSMSLAASSRFLPPSMLAVVILKARCGRGRKVSFAGERPGGERQ